MIALVALGVLLFVVTVVSVVEYAREEMRRLVANHEELHHADPGGHVRQLRSLNVPVPKKDRGYGLGQFDRPWRGAS